MEAHDTACARTGGNMTNVGQSLLAILIYHLPSLGDKEQQEITDTIIAFCQGSDEMKETAWELSALAERVRERYLQSVTQEES